MKKNTLTGLLDRGDCKQQTKNIQLHLCAVTPRIQPLSICSQQFICDESRGIKSANSLDINRYLARNPQKKCFGFQRNAFDGYLWSISCTAEAEFPSRALSCCNTLSFITDLATLIILSLVASFIYFCQVPPSALSPSSVLPPIPGHNSVRGGPLARSPTSIDAT